MTFLFYIFIFIFGLAVGSFLNVLISRLPQEKGISGRSRCPECGHVLAWQDLIPLVSFILLKGRCRYCGKPISWQYPIIELTTGILFLLLFFGVPLLGKDLGFAEDSIFSLTLKGGLQFFYYLFIASCFIVIFVSDLKHFIIPDEVILWGSGAVFLYQTFLAFDFMSMALRSGNKVATLLCPEFVEGVKLLIPYLLAALGASAFFLLIVVATKGKGMGLGDVKLAFLMGLILGWPKILIALLFAFVSGALVGLGLIVAGKARMKSSIPFGTFLSASAFLVMIFGDIILNYLQSIAV